jgi:cell division ATPase FtsA
VDSLFAVLRRAGLEAASLTLEPIAALEVSIPPGMRQLNLALVDIGAGTSDIALVRHGHIYAYAMVPVAGDEITDALCQRYLLDFAGGEAVKRRLTAGGAVTFTDILGQRREEEAASIIRELTPAIESLAEQVAAEILNLNGRPPDAVLLVGGGSLTPTLPRPWLRHWDSRKTG